MIDVMREFSTESESHHSKSDLLKQLKAIGGRAPNSREINAIKALEKIDGASGEHFKITEKNSRYGTDLNLAKNYIWASLNTQQRSKLQAVAALQGLENETAYIEGLLFDAQGIQSSLKVSPEDDPNASKTGAANLSTFSEPETFYQGKLDMGQSFAWNDPKTGTKMAIPVTGKTQLTSNSKPVGRATLRHLQTTDEAPLWDVDKVTYGGKKISPWELDSIIYDGDVGARAYMPVNADGTPNYEILRRYEEASEEIKRNPDWGVEEINDYYAKTGLGFIQVNKEKVVVPNEYLKPFLIFHAYTTNKFEVTDDNDNIKKLSNAEERNIKPMLQLFTEEHELPSMTNFFGTDYYKGLVAYPIMEDASARISAMKHNIYAPKTNINTVKANMTKFKGKNLPQNSSTVYQ